MIFGGKGIFTRTRKTESSPLRKSTFESRRRAPLATLERVQIFGRPTTGISRWYGLVVVVPLALCILSCSAFVLSIRYGTTTPSGLRGNDEIQLSSAVSNFAQDEELIRNNQKDNDDLMKLSLWLIPPSGDDESDDGNINVNNNDGSKTYGNSNKNTNKSDSVFDRAQNFINKLSAELNGPEFLPHITIVGGIEVRSESEAMVLAEKLRTGLSGFGPVECSFGDLVLSAPHCWNQALVLEVVPPLDKFQSLCKLSRKLLGMEQPQTDSCVIFPPPLKIPHMSLYYGESPPPPSDDYLSELFSSQKKSFKGQRVMLWNTDPSSADGASEWKPLADISLL